MHWEDVSSNHLLPHESLHQARFLRPFETPLQEYISSGHIDGKEPCCLQPKSVIMRTVHGLFDNCPDSISLSTITAPGGRRGICPQGSNMKTPHQPRNDKISRFDERCGDKGSRGGNEPDEEEANACVWGGRWWWKCRILPLLLTWFLLSRPLFVGVLTTKSSYSSPGTEEVDRCCEIFDCRMVEQNAEDVEGVMAIVCKCERVDEGVIVDDRQHDSYDRNSYYKSRRTTFDGAEA